MRRGMLWLGPLLMLGCCAQAWAGEADAVMGMPGADYLLSLGPFGALVWGAYVIGKGMRLTIQVELSERDREILEKLGSGS